MSIAPLSILCQNVILETLERNNFHPKLINDLCRRIPHYLLEGVFNELLERRALTDVALVAFLVPGRTDLKMKGSVQIRNATFKQISYNCPNLKTLNLSDCVQVSNSVVRALLQGCPVLSELLLDRCHRVTDAAFDMNQSPFQPLIGCLSLEAISLQGCPQVTGSVVQNLNKLCGKLKYLNLSQCKHIEPPAIQQIFEHHELLSVNLAFIDGVSDEAFLLFPVPPEFPLSPSSSLSDVSADSGSLGTSHSPRVLEMGGGLSRAIRYAGMGPPIQILNLGKSSITNNSLFRMAYLTALLEIHLQWCSGISDAGVEALSMHCPRLELIDLKSCPITDAAVEAIARNSRNIRSLDVSWCTGVTDSGISAMVDIILALQAEMVGGIDPGEEVEMAAVHPSELDSATTTVAASAMIAAGDVGSSTRANEAMAERGEYEEEREPATAAETTASAAYFPTLVHAAGGGMVDRTRPDAASSSSRRSRAPAGNDPPTPKGLQHLSLVWCAQLTDRALVALAELPKFKSLEVGGCRGITTAGVEALRAAGVEVAL